MPQLLLYISHVLSAQLRRISMLIITAPSYYLWFVTDKSQPTSNAFGSVCCGGHAFPYGADGSLPYNVSVVSNIMPTYCCLYR